MKIILCGYHWTGCKALELLLDEGHEVYVYTHKTENYIADLEGLCIRKQIEYSLDKITAGNLPFVPDMICSIYYRWIIKQDVIDIVKGRIFNLHPALLPKYRGCSSLTWAMINGENKCGFTYHYINAGCDTGNIILQRSIQIEDFDTQLTLYNRVMFESMNCFLEAVHLVQNGYEGKVQEGVTTYYKRGCPLDGKITDEMDEQMKERFIRAMCYPPYPAAQYHGQEIATLRELQKFPGGGYRVILYGCGGHARSMINVFREISTEIDLILVDSRALDGESILGCQVERDYRIDENDGYIIAIGDNQKRRQIYEQMQSYHIGHCISLISMSANLGIASKIGEGTFIAPEVYIGPQTVIGNNTIINTGSIIEHETVVGDHTHIAPRVTVCGRSRIGNYVFCGAGSTVIDKITICDNVIVGAGAVVKEDILEAGTYVGIPAKRVSQ